MWWWVRVLPPPGTLIWRFPGRVYGFCQGPAARLVLPTGLCRRIMGSLFMLASVFHVKRQGDALQRKAADFAEAEETLNLENGLVQWGRTCGDWVWIIPRRFPDGRSILRVHPRQLRAVPSHHRNRNFELDCGIGWVVQISRSKRTSQVGSDCAACPNRNQHSRRLDRHNQRPWSFLFDRPSDVSSFDAGLCAPLDRQDFQRYDRQAAELARICTAAAFLSYFINVSTLPEWPSLAPRQLGRWESEFIRAIRFPKGTGNCGGR